MRRLLVLALLTASTPAAADELVDITTVIPDAVLDLRYATANNFTGEVVYPSATCKLRTKVAARLAKVAAVLRKQQRRLLIYDCYRPTSVQEKFWALVPDPRYVADPKQGSRHSRGAAVDLALVDGEGEPVPLPTEFDDFTPAAHRKRALVGAKGREAKRLAAAMTKAGFVGMPTEWWHFDAPDAALYPLSNAAL